MTVRFAMRVPMLALLRFDGRSGKNFARAKRERANVYIRKSKLFK